MLALFATLTAIYLRLGIGKSGASLSEKLCVQLPFSVYLGWITVALFANVAAALVSVGLDGFGLSAQTWTIIALIIVLTVTLSVIVARRDIAYSLVIVWALAGIAVKQNVYLNIVIVTEVAIVVVLVSLALSFIAQKIMRKRVP